MKGTVRISLIAALTPSGVIGQGNTIPWRISEDLRLFKRLTLHHPVIMGRKTFESLPGGPLTGRRNLVVSRSRTGTGETSLPEGAEFYASLEEALNAASDPAGGMLPGEVFVIGGAQIYSQTLPLADRLYLSRVHREYPGDTRFPSMAPEDWELTETETFEEFTLEIYDRIRDPAVLKTAPCPRGP